MNDATVVLIAYATAFTVVTGAYYRRLNRHRRDLRLFARYVEHELMSDLKDPVIGDKSLPYISIDDEWIIREVGHTILYRVRVVEIHPITVLLERVNGPTTRVWHKRTEIEWIEIVRSTY